MGLRVGYASGRLLAIASGVKRGAIILALTANAYYTLDGIRPGMPVVRISGRLHLGKPIHLGPNWWYTSVGHSATIVLKVRHHVIQEVGIASRALTATRAEQARLLVNF